MIDLGLVNKIALITGANTGIGREIALALAEQGATILIHYLKEAAFTPEKGVLFEETIAKEKAEWRHERAVNLKNQITKNGGAAEVIAADLSKVEAANALFDFVESKFGSVDILVNNAAHCELPDSILETTASTIDRHFTVNTKAAILLIREFSRRLIATGKNTGRIVNLSTDSAQSFAGQISYGASKAAMEAYTRSLAIELGPYGITVNAISPGPIQTGWISEELEKQVVPTIPVGRLGYPKDIADFLLFLVSEQASFVTGQVIKVSGGHAI